jgi:membrane-associated phospholipid phosphatase
MDALVKVVAKDFIVIPVLVAIYFWLKVLPRDKRKSALINLVVLGVLSLLFATLAQHLYTNPRPSFKDGSVPLFQPSDYNGFPSDHTLFASVIAFWLMMYNRRWGVVMLGLAVVIGWGRVAAHVHHTVDVWGAILIAGLAYLLTLYIQPRLLVKKAK